MWISISHRLMAVSGAALLACLLVFSLSNPGVVAPPSSSTSVGDSNQGPTCRAKPQMAPIPYHVDKYSIHSGRHTAASQAGNQVVFKTLVQSLDAPWLQIQFGSSSLGRSSYLKITALSTGATQQLDAATLALWHNQSAMFKGDTVTLELFAAPEDKDVFFEVESLMAGEWVGGMPLRSSRPSVTQWEPPSTPLDVTHFNPDMVCGADDRVASNDPAVGRIVPVGCTGFVISNGAFLTAGHCFDVNMTTIQFKVPASNADGTINPPDPNDQYPIDRSNVTWRNNGEGDDWTVFRVTRNATTTLTPPLAYGSFYRVFLNQPFTVRVTGYGVDGPAPCFGERRQPGCNIPAPTPVPQNADNQTQQTAIGAGLGVTGTTFSHDVDITGGNSGGPVRHPDYWQAVAIHTWGTFDANCTSGHNAGTAFSNAALAAAINNFPGANARYVDAALPTLAEDGTLFHPFDLLTEGLNAVPTGGIVSVVAGHYNEPMTINKNVVLEAPVGTVVIGAP